MRKRGLSEAIVWAHNPLPDISDAELLTIAGLDSVVPKANSPFAMKWQFASGLEREDVEIAPGGFMALRASEAVEMERELREQGLVIIEKRENEDEILAKSDIGLRAALEFWRSRGLPKLIAYRQRHGLTNEDMEVRKFELWAYHFAAAKAAKVEEQLKAIGAKRAQRMREAGAAKAASVEQKANVRADRVGAGSAA